MKSPPNGVPISSKYDHSKAYICNIFKSHTKIQWNNEKELDQITNKKETNKQKLETSIQKNAWPNN